MNPLKYLSGYPPHLLAGVQRLVDDGRLHAHLAKRYPDGHDVRSDRALYDYVLARKHEHMRNAESLAKVVYDNKLHVVQHALGTHTTAVRVQGHKLKTKREIRVASLMKQAPEPFLRMIVVHELAHLRHREHDKKFYALCESMEPDYHQLEFDARLWLLAQELPPPAPPDTASPGGPA
jgi:predicted metal-dependent hydrolase